MMVKLSLSCFHWAISKKNQIQGMLRKPWPDDEATGMTMKSLSMTSEAKVVPQVMFSHNKGPLKISWMCLTDSNNRASWKFKDITPRHLSTSQGNEVILKRSMCVTTLMELTPKHFKEAYISVNSLNWGGQDIQKEKTFWTSRHL